MHRHRVGVWHFHPIAVALAKSQKTPFSRVTFDPSTASSMMPALTLCERINLPGKSYGLYINAPVMSFSNMVDECERLDDAKVQLGDLYATGASSANTASLRSAPEGPMLLGELTINNLENTVREQRVRGQLSDDLARRVEELEKELSSYRLGGTGIHGLTRANLVSDAFHAANPHCAKHLFGFSDWDFTKKIV